MKQRGVSDTQDPLTLGCPCGLNEPKFFLPYVRSATPPFTV